MNRSFISGFAAAVVLGCALRAGLTAADAVNAIEPDPAPAFQRQELTNLWRIKEWQHEVPWKEFRPGVEIHRLYGDGVTGPVAALLRYKDSAKVPLHTHPGYEHILILAGSQRDQNGVLRAGTLAIHPPGTSHSVVSEEGCIVLAIYEKPVRFTTAPPPAVP